MKLWRLLRQLCRAQRGSVAVEAAFIAPVIIALLVGTINYGGVMLARTELFNAVHAGLQYALISPTDVDGMKTAAQNASSTETGAGTMTVTTANSCYCADGITVQASGCNGSCTGGDSYQMATITASQDYSYLLHFPGFPTSTTLSETASVRNNF
ncbi:MAG TPA: TadE/TadG family type IV pilus assembly protein [Dongiaceae bacterium]|nr:TadE/TadG family type IV pilus assembly protein [Dongiaceae bacterium]